MADLTNVLDTMQKIQEQAAAAKKQLADIEAGLPFDADIREALKNQFLDPSQLYLAQIMRILHKSSKSQS